MKEERVILVDETDSVTGSCEKIEAHQKGLLHRAFSIFIFNTENQLILQKRSNGKYHSPGLWSNTCCGHPRPGEELNAAANRRLHEEMGIKCGLKHKYHFIYKTALENNLVEHELDHVFVGQINEMPKINSDEVSEWKAIEISELKKDIELNPNLYTYWFKVCIKNIEKITGTFFQP